MSREPEHSVQTAGFWIFGFLSVVLAALKLTVAPYWSWWRVMLPLLAFLGHKYSDGLDILPLAQR